MRWVSRIQAVWRRVKPVGVLSMEKDHKSEPAGMPPPIPSAFEKADQRGSDVSDRRHYFKRWLNRFILLRECCPICSEYAVRWIKDWVVHPEEPPMFGHWICDECHAATPVLPTRLTVRAAKDVLPTATGETKRVLESMIKDAERSGIF